MIKELQEVTACIHSMTRVSFNRVSKLAHICGEDENHIGYIEIMLDAFQGLNGERRFAAIQLINEDEEFATSAS